MREIEQGSQRQTGQQIFTYHPNSGKPKKGIAGVARIRLAKFKKGVGLCKSFSKTSRKFSTNSKGGDDKLGSKTNKTQAPDNKHSPEHESLGAALLAGPPAALSLSPGHPLKAGVTETHRGMMYGPHTLGPSRDHPTPGSVKGWLTPLNGSGPCLRLRGRPPIFLLWVGAENRRRERRRRKK